MQRGLVFLLVIVALIGGPVAAAAVQDIDVAFSDVKLRELGYPEVRIHVGPDGVEAPSTLDAGFYLVSFSSEGDYAGYMDIVQPPAGLDEATATELALAAGRDDLAQPGWTYVGGTNTFEEGVPVSFAVYLAPGEYSIAASYYLEDSEEIMKLVPLTVTGAATPVAGSPVASPAATPVATNAPAVDVTLEMTDDLEYIVSPGVVPAGPQIWEITNTGMHHSHHVVMFGVPDGVTAEDIIAEFSALFAGTPPVASSISASMTPAGYAALQSGGQTTWNEFDLTPGTYAVICFIVDIETGRPHLMDGMVTTFTVE
jgi:hypothetical protein